MTFLRLSHPQEAFNAAGKTKSPSEKQSNPWVQTPLRESYALSEAAGWYGHISYFSSSPLSCIDTWFTVM